MRTIVIILVSLVALTSCQSLIGDIQGRFAGNVIVIDAPERSKTTALQSQGKATGPAVSENRAPSSNLGQRLERDGWSLADIDTARDADFLSEAEKDVILASNAVRTDPRRFADIYVAELRSRYAGSLIEYPGEIAIRTVEGTRAVDELTGYLRTARPQPALVPSLGMSSGAADHASDQSKSGATGHTGGDRSSPFDRIDRYGSWNGTAGENISYGYGDGLRIVLQLLVDDGVPSRGHRDNIMNGQFGVSGVAVDSHPVYGNVCVITYAASYTEAR
jgi:uncharacterized protein YkwD